MATIRTHFFHRPEECDSFQPCFFDHEDVEFYGTRAPMTSDEIWDKFELLPTPPRSPNRDPLPDLSSSLLDIEAERLHLQPLISDELLAECIAEFISESPKQCFPESPAPLTGVGGLNSKLIQDCMWSGKNVQPFIDPCVEKKKGEKSDITNCSSRKNNRCDNFSGLDSSISSDCVDPSVVFPYPINREYPDIDTPSDSGNEEDEDEEIDVVNVEKAQVPQLPHKQRSTPVIRIPEKVVKKSVTHVASLLLPAVHACHTYSKQMPVGRNYEHVSRSTNSSPVHNHSATHKVIKRTSVSVSMPSSPRHHRPSKRARRHLATPSELKRVAQKLKSCGSGRNVKTEYYSSSSSCSSRVGSDSEGETGPGGKRTQHNVLERKRRNDLKYSFFKLRDAVPELCQQEKAPKVVILKKATDYINDLTFKQNCLATEYERQKARRNKLRETLQLLHDS